MAKAVAAGARFSPRARLTSSGAEAAADLCSAAGVHQLTRGQGGARIWAVGIAGRGHANRLAPPSRLRLWLERVALAGTARRQGRSSSPGLPHLW